MSSPFGNRTFNGNNAAPTQQVAFEKAKGFINLYLPGIDGDRIKIGAIALRESNDMENRLLAVLSEADGLQKIANKVEFEYRAVKPMSERGFALD